jgi:hypothetical protein
MKIIYEFREHVNTALLQIVLSEPEWAARMTAADRRALTPLFWTHVNLYGKFDLDMSTRLDLGPRRPSTTSPPLADAVGAGHLTGG